MVISPLNVLLGMNGTILCGSTLTEVCPGSWTASHESQNVVHRGSMCSALTTSCRVVVECASGTVPLIGHLAIRVPDRKGPSLQGVVLVKEIDLFPGRPTLDSGLGPRGEQPSDAS
jgi:hypothetical protein